MDNMLENKMKELAKQLTEDKGVDTKLLDVSDLCEWTDYIIIVSAMSRTHMRGLYESVIQFGRDLEWDIFSPKPSGSEDLWVLIDCGFVVVNIMTDEGRDHYQLEEYWENAKNINFIE